MNEVQKAISAIAFLLYLLTKPQTSHEAKNDVWRVEVNKLHTPLPRKQSLPQFPERISHRRPFPINQTAQKKEKKRKEKELSKRRVMLSRVVISKYITVVMSRYTSTIYNL